MLILVSLYTANLAAILSTHFEEKPLQTIDEVVQSGRKIYAFKYEKSFLQHIPNPSMIQLLKENRVHFEFDVTMGNQKDTLDKIKSSLKDGSIWIGFDSHMDEVMKQITNLYKLEGYFSFFGFSFAMRSDWKWADRLKRQFSEYSAMGYFDQLRQKYDHREFGKEISDDKSEIPFVNLVGVFGIALLGGFCTAIFQIVYFFLEKGRKIMMVEPETRPYTWQS